MDLVQKGFYDGMAIQRSDGFVVQVAVPGLEPAVLGSRCVRWGPIRPTGVTEGSCAALRAAVLELWSAL